MKELAAEFEKQFTCLGKLHNLYSSNRKKVTRTDKNGEDITKNISYRLQLIDIERFKASS